MLSFVALTPSLAEAQNKPDEVKLDEVNVGLTHIKKCHPGSVTVCAIFLEPGEGAPFRGVLSTPEQAAKAVASEEATARRIEAALVAQASKHDAEVEGLKDLHESDLALKDETIELWKKTAEDAAPDWYEKPWFVATASVLATIAAVTGSVYLYDKVRR